MKRLMVFLLAVSMLPLFNGARAGEPARNADKDDLDKLQGEWVPVRWIVQGKEIPSGKEQTNFTFTRKKLTANEQTGTFSIDPSKKPKTMDVALPLVTATWSYRIDGDTLQIAFGKVGEKPPANFSGNDGKLVLILKRKKK